MRGRRTALTLVALLLALIVASGASAAPRNEARYVTMRDGVRIAIDVWLPRGGAARLPTLVRATRYWRAIGYKDPAAPDSNLEEATAVTSAGYALVLVDVRGSGASFGRWPYPWSRAEIRDLSEIVDWIVRQPWSNDRVGAYGISYDGNTADFMSLLGNPAVKAVIPRFSDYDPYRHIAFPGGVFSDWFVREWSEGNRVLDRNDLCAGATPAQCARVRRVIWGPKPVDADPNGRLLRAAIRSHRRNGDTAGLARGFVFRDDLFAGARMSVWSPSAYADRLQRSGVAIQAWASWLDAGTADGALTGFANADTPQTVLIGAWGHGAFYDADPFHPANAPLTPSIPEQIGMMVAFLDPYLKRPRPPAPVREIRYYTLGEDAWHTTPSWPPAGVANETWYFRADGLLAREAPADASAADTYLVDFTAATGPRNRWHTQNGGADVVYPNRAAADAKLLTYTSEPLTADLEITGHPVVALHVSSTADDGALYVYLEDVSPEGRVTYVTEGVLRALHRRVTRPAPLYHSYLRADGQPLVPGEVAEIRFALQPVSVLVRAGHRLRVAIAGHDAGTFARIPATGSPVLTVERSSARPSGVELPVRAR